MGCNGSHNDPRWWDARFTAQLAWTARARDTVYRRLGFSARDRFLEIGCGTGALLQEIHDRFIQPRHERGKAVELHGIDIDPAFTTVARERFPPGRGPVHVVDGDARKLPFDDGCFDVVACHYLLLWIPPGDRATVIDEARRVLRPGGVLACLGEPDYSGRIDAPDNELGQLLARALEVDGGDPTSGRRLAADLSASFDNVVIECCSTPWTAGTWQQHFDEEWNAIKRVLESIPLDDETIAALKARERDAVENGSKFTFMPVFLAHGRKPGRRG